MRKIFAWKKSKTPAEQLPPETAESESEKMVFAEDCEDMDKTLILPESRNWHLDIGMSSIIGTRKNQQDAADAVKNRRGDTLAVLCDGMGGLEGGEKASNLCVRMFCEDFLSYEGNDYPGFLCREVNRADRQVVELKNDEGKSLRAGTTLLGVVVTGNHVHIVSVGDSRIYILRGTEIIQATRDHNYSLLLKEQVERHLISEAEAEQAERKEALISYIGMGYIAKIEVNERPFVLMDGDMILMCSDGLYKVMDEGTMRQIINLYNDNMTETAQMLTAVSEKIAQSGQDNTTVIIMKYIE